MAVREHHPDRLDADDGLCERFERRGRKSRAAADVERTPHPRAEPEVLANRPDDVRVDRGPVVRILRRQPGTVVDAP
jgi:hypothetical protein